jgi:micrococcal nuclease
MRVVSKMGLSETVTVRILAGLCVVLLGLLLISNKSPQEMVHTAVVSEVVKEEQVNDDERTDAHEASVRSVQETGTEGLIEDSTSTKEVGRVVRVIDGDTIEVEVWGVKERVRYIGIDTPETVHPSKPVECFGKEASVQNKMLVEGKEVYMERDVTDRDKYGRLLRYVYVGDVLVNEALVRGGYASVYTYPPDVKYDGRFRDAERSAREESRGLWSSVCAVKHSDPAVEVVSSTVSDSSECTIKGNINANGEKIFHVQGCKSYNATRINVEAGERWFCSEAEALEAGWRKALNCG